MSIRTGWCKKFFLICSLLALAALVAIPQAAFAANGVDDPLLVFQLEGNVTNESDICFLLNANGAFTAPYTGSCPGGFAHVSFGATTDDFIDMIHVYPTMAEALKIVAISFTKDVNRLSCCAS